MPQQVIRYKCGICDNEYELESDCIFCESLDYPIQEFNIGNIISFTMEEYTEGGKLSRNNKQLPVTAATIVRGNNDHQYVYLVEEKVGNAVIAERIVLKILNGDSYTSPITGQTPPGFSKILKGLKERAALN